VTVVPEVINESFSPVY